MKQQNETEPRPELLGKGKQQVPEKEAPGESPLEVGMLGARAYLAEDNVLPG